MRDIGCLSQAEEKEIEDFVRNLTDRVIKRHHLSSNEKLNDALYAMQDLFGSVSVNEAGNNIEMD